MKSSHLPLNFDTINPAHRPVVVICVLIVFCAFYPSRKHAFEKELASQIWKVKYGDIVIRPAMGIGLSRISNMSEV